MHQTTLCDPINNNLGDLMKDLTVQPITAAKMLEGGTQNKSHIVKAERHSLSLCALQVT
jgi:hypothetical protein